MFDVTKGGDPEMFRGKVSMARATSPSFKEPLKNALNLRAQYYRWLMWKRVKVFTLFLVGSVVGALGVLGLYDMLISWGWTAPYRPPVLFFVGVGIVIGVVYGSLAAKDYK